VKTSADRLISGGGFNNKIQIGCNIHQLPQLVNVKFSAKSRRRSAYPSKAECSIGIKTDLLLSVPVVSPLNSYLCVSEIRSIISASFGAKNTASAFPKRVNRQQIKLPPLQRGSCEKIRSWFGAPVNRQVFVNESFIQCK
jgi:hypothetical protein